MNSDLERILEINRLTKEIWKILENQNNKESNLYIYRKKDFIKERNDSKSDIKRLINIFFNRLSFQKIVKRLEVCFPNHIWVLPSVILHRFNSKPIFEMKEGTEFFILEIAEECEVIKDNNFIFLVKKVKSKEEFNLHKMESLEKRIEKIPIKKIYDDLLFKKKVGFKNET